MENSKAKWITDGVFAQLAPLNVFHKEKDNGEKHYDEELLNYHLLFRKSFEAGRGKHEIRISADDYYYLYINGAFVRSGPAPGYPWHYYYNRVDVSRFIRPGVNVIAVHTVYHGLINRVWVSGDRRQGLILSLTEDGNEILCSDGSFKCKRHSGYHDTKLAVQHHDTAFCDNYDSRAAEVGFERSEFDDGGWDCCKVRTFTDYTLYDQPTAPIEYRKLTPQTVKKTPTGLFVDLGREIAGFISLNAKGKRGSRVIIRYAEELDENGALMFHTRCNCDYEDEWTLSGADDVFKPCEYKGFRYAEILCDPDAVDESSVCATVRHYPFTNSAACPIDDETIQRVWKLCSDTVEYGVQECFVDCPTREKGQYLGDTCVSAVAQAILTGKCDMLSKSLVDFAESSRICPGLMAVSTSSFMQEIADFSLCYPHALLWYHKLSGDTELLKALYPTVAGLCDYFKRYERGDGLIESVTDKWNLVDWPVSLRDGYDFPITRPMGPGVHVVLNALYIGMLKNVNVIRGLIGEPRQSVERYERAFVSAFYDADSGLFRDGENSSHSAVHGNALALLYDLGMNEKSRRSVIRLIREKGVTSSGTYFSYYVMQALKNAGERQLVLDFIKDGKAWLNMLAHGATTTFEAWDVSYKKNCSLFHPWSCAPILILYDM